MSDPCCPLKNCRRNRFRKVFAAAFWIPIFWSFWICRKISLNENPSVGVVLCASKDDAVVEYVLSRSISPTLVSDYKLCLPDKEALQAKLREVTDIALEQADK